MENDRPGLRVLVVEDDDLISRLIVRALSPKGCHVVAASDGAAALRALGDSRFDAVAVDITLPDASGHDIIAEARRRIPGAGIVAVTGHVNVEVAVQSMKSGADDFVSKPFEVGVFWHILNKAVESRRHQIEAERAATYRQLAYTDALTGAPNRRFIEEFLADAAARAEATRSLLTVGYVDIDNFKLFNDFVGHQRGDELLIAVSAALEETLEPPATFARYGGDEFVVVFPGMGLEAARLALEPARRRIERVTVMSGDQFVLPTRMSIGVAMLTGGASPRSLIADAEAQMYLDKSVAAAVISLQGERSHSVEVDQPGRKVKALRSLVKAIDRRDSYTRFHSDHATHLAIGLARRIGLGEADLATVTIAGPIHDLGKIVVPDEILRKPGPLNRDERRTMEEHPVMGAAIVAAVADIDGVIDLVRHHHERFDGKGYPGGLRGVDIPVLVRVFGLADSLSAMVTDRPYRKGLAIERALREISRCLGTQFDPDLGAEFVRMVEAEGHTAFREDVA